MRRNFGKAEVEAGQDLTQPELSGKQNTELRRGRKGRTERMWEPDEGAKE